MIMFLGLYIEVVDIFVLNYKIFIHFLRYDSILFRKSIRV